MGNDAQVIIDVITKTDGSTKELRGVNAQLRQMSNSARAAFTPIERVSNSIDKQANMAHKAKFAFQGWALSVMFAGMAMQRAFNAIWQSGSKTFNDIMHSVEGTVTGFDNLNNSITYLQFVAGQALEPLADALVPIIDFISQIIEDHPDAFRWITAAVGIVGTLFTAIGFTTLALAGMAEAIIKISTAWRIVSVLPLFSSAFWVTLWGNITAVASALWAAVAPVLAAAAPWLILAGLIIAAVGLGIFLGAIWDQVLTGWGLKIKYVGTMFEEFWQNLKMSAGDSVTWVVEKIKKMIEAYNSLPFVKPISLAGIDSVLKGLNDVRNASVYTMASIHAEQDKLLYEMHLNEQAGNANLMDTINQLKATLGLGQVAQPVNNNTSNTTNLYAQTIDQNLLDEINRQINARTA